jgi:hypothetical protein
MLVRSIWTECGTIIFIEHPAFAEATLLLGGFSVRPIVQKLDPRLSCGWRWSATI